MNYYEMLNIENDASQDEIVKAFRKTIKECHPDRVKDPEEKKVAESKFQMLTEAFNTLKDSEKRIEYNERLNSTSDDKQDKEILASQYFKNGLHQLNNEENNRLAEEFFRKAVHLDDTNAKYFYYLGLTQSKESRKLRESVANLEKAMALDPFISKYPALIGSIYLESGMNTRAIQYFNKALVLDDGNNEALQGLTTLGKGPKEGFWAKIFNRK